MKRATRTIVILSLALTSCRGPMLAPTQTPQTVSVCILATTTTFPLLQDLAAGYARPGVLLAVHSEAVSWDTIADRLQLGQVPFALTTYIPPGANLWAAPIGQDGLAIIVDAANPVPALTADDLRRIFQGRVTQWADLGGPDLPITVVSREDGADSRQVFQALVMGARRTTLAARLALSDRSMVDVVASVPGAIGYVSMGRVDDRVRMVPVTAGPGEPAITPTRDNVSDNTYPLRTPILIVGPAPPEPDSPYRDWFAWMQSPEGQAIVGQRFGPLRP